MKLHRIAVRNLNSLVGDQELDLERDLGAPALFLIHGRTGAGKSTLLDAISLALFGRTPRLDGRRNAPDADPGLVMSRGTGDCRAEVEFSRLATDGPGRLRYRAIWQLRRARGSERGRLQSPERSLEFQNASGKWQLLASGRKQSSFDQALREALHGFSADDFFRSMLLAQGRFDEFLGAAPEQRAAILERLTDTARYRELGLRAATAARAVGTRSALARQRLQLHPKVSADEHEQARVGAAQAQAITEQLAVQLADTRRLLEYLSRRQALEERLTDLARNEAELEQRATRLTPQQTRLAEHQRCRAGFDILHRLELTRNQLRERSCDLERRRAETESLDTRLCELREQGARLFAERDQTLALAQQLATSAAELSADSERLTSARGRQLRITERLRTLVQTLAELTERRSRQNAAFDEVTHELDETTRKAAPALLGTPPTTRLTELRRTLAAARAELETANQAELATLAFETRSREHRDLEAHAQRLHAAIAELALRLEQTKQRVTTLAQQDRVIEVELQATRLSQQMMVHRSTLKPGEPCPLCGAVDHPFSDPNQPNPGKCGPELLSDQLRERQEALQNDLVTAEQAARTAEIELERARTEQRLYEERIALSFALLADESEKATRACAEAKLTGASPSQIHDFHDRAKARFLELETAQTLLTELSLRASELTNERDKLAIEHQLRAAELLEYEEQRNQASGELKELEASVTARATEMERLWHQFEPDPAASAQAELPLARLVHGRVADAQRRVSHLRQACAELDTNQKTIEKEHATLSGQLSLLETQRIEQITTERALELELSSVLEQLGLRSSEELAAHKLTDSEIQQTERELDALARERASTQDLLAERRRDWELCESTRPPGFNLTWLETGTEAMVTLNERIVAGEREHAAALAEAAQTRTALAELERRSRLHQDAERALAEAEGDGAVWLALDELVGTRDGESFQRFAQGLNLHLLLRQANTHLARLSGRYRLAGQGSPLQSSLDLTIVDLWHLGETRSTRSLSGGERFLVSLALALGLSDMRTPSLPIETLLLDEGFGSLDTETLDTALSALQSLEREGRQIGIISHVPELRERISAQVQILELGGGRSRIVVPQAR